MHYNRFRRHGNTETKLGVKRDPLERFWEKVDKSGECWVWKNYKVRAGYPRFYPGDTTRDGTVLAHRWIYERMNGPIPGNMHVDHMCRTRACVRPDHLRLLDPSEHGRITNKLSGWTAKSMEDLEELLKLNTPSVRVSRETILALIAELRALRDKERSK